MVVANDVIIENPVLNSPFDEPDRHFQFTDEGITNDIVHERRVSSYFIPFARPRGKGKNQLEFDTEWTQDRIEENKAVNRIRERIRPWRHSGYVGVTPVTARLLAYWTNPERDKRLFFCQIEALETAIYITEVARKQGDTFIEADLRHANDGSNPGLPRIAFKMATGSGKTVVMAMMIAWQALNKFANPQDARFADAFLIVPRHHDPRPVACAASQRSAELLPAARHPAERLERATGPGQDRDHQLPCFQATRERQRRKADQGDSRAGGARPVPGDARPRWCGASAANWATSATSW
jgi:hypothetical protein